MIVTGFISFGLLANPPFDNSDNNTKTLVLGADSWISLQSSQIGKNHHLNAIILASIGEDLAIDKNSCVLPSPGLFSYSDIQQRLRAKDQPSIELSCCFNRSKSEISLTRGIFGTIPLYYFYIPNAFFCFSTSLKSLTQLTVIQPLLSKNESTIASFLSLNSLSKSYSNETVYRQIFTVLPGHELTASAAEVRSFPYVSFDINQWEHLKKKAEFAEIFKTNFEQSLKFAVSDAQVIGSHLSGGLDSSSISAMTKHLFPERTLHTFFGDTNTQETNEGHYAIEVANKINSIHHVINAPNDEIDKAILHTSIYGAPLNLAHSPARQNKILQSIKNTGCNIILSGQGGDSIVGYGMEYITKLITQRNWQEAKRQFAQMASLIQQPVYHASWAQLTLNQRQNIYAREYLYRVLGRKFRSVPFSQFLPIAFELCKQFSISPFFLFNRVTKNVIGRRLEKSSILSHQFLEQGKEFNNNLTPDLSKILYRDIPPEIQGAYGPVYNNSSITIREDTFALSNHYGIITQFPLYHKALLEISMATPSVFKYDNGLRRGHFREAMKGLLPENVRLRFGKAAFDRFAMRSALRLYDQSQDFLTQASPVWEYVDRKKFNQLVKKLKLENEGPSTFTYTYLYVNRVIFLSIWLDWYNRNIR